VNEQPVSIGQQPALAADQRRERIADLTNDHSEVIDDYTEKLFEIATDLCERTHGRSPVTLLTDLLEYWLLNADPSMQVDSHKDRLRGTLAAIQSIDRIGKIVAEIQYFRGEIINMQEQLEILDQQGKEVRGE
jgi:hypothetical protein